MAEPDGVEVDRGEPAEGFEGLRGVPGDDRGGRAEPPEAVLEGVADDECSGGFDVEGDAAGCVAGVVDGEYVGAAREGISIFQHVVHRNRAAVEKRHERAYGPGEEPPADGVGGREGAGDERNVVAMCGHGGVGGVYKACEAAHVVGVVVGQDDEAYLFDGGSDLFQAACDEGEAAGPACVDEGDGVAVDERRYLRSQGAELEEVGTSVQGFGEPSELHCVAPLAAGVGR